MYLSNFVFDSKLERISQERGLRWLREAYNSRHPGQAEEIDRCFERYACSSEHIQFRRTALYDLTEVDCSASAPHLFAKGQNPLLEQRMQVYSQQVRQVRDRLFTTPSELTADKMIHVSCTGYEYPNAAQEWAAREPQKELSLFNLYHMGCYAAIPAVELARGLCLNSTSGRTEVFHSEFCTLHLDLTKVHAEQIIVQSLFADGGIRYQVSKSRPENLASLEVLATHEQRVPDSLCDMTWQLSHQGFAMGLSKAVPSKIGLHLPGFLMRLFEKAGLPIEDEISPETLWAIHPGGPKIVDAVKEAFGLEEEQVAMSRQVLREHGNMSSVTLPKIWQEVLELKHAEGRPILSLAFGPGLTIAGALLCPHR